MFLSISFDSGQIQKCTIPHLKAENIIITVYFMHFLQKITVRVATDKNVCIIFFVTVSMLFLHLSCISNHFSVNHEKPISFCQFSPLIGHSDQQGGYSEKIKSIFANLTKNSQRQGKTVKTTYFTHYISYLNPKGEVDNFKID